MTHHNICDECETVAHCSNHGCIPKVPASVQEPVAWVDLLKQAEEVVRSKSLWKKYIDGTPLANDIAVWMASFAQEHTTPPAAPDLQAELDATNRQVEILSDALAESRREVAALKAVQEPVAWCSQCGHTCPQTVNEEPVGWWDAKIGFFEEKHFDQLCPLYTTPPAAQPASCPHGMVDTCCENYSNCNLSAAPVHPDSARIDWLTNNPLDALDIFGHVKGSDAVRWIRQEIDNAMLKKDGATHD